MLHLFICSTLILTGAGNGNGAEPDQTTPSQATTTTRPRVIDHTHEVVIVQGGTADIPASITQITQVSRKNVPGHHFVN